MHFWRCFYQCHLSRAPAQGVLGSWRALVRVFPWEENSRSSLTATLLLTGGSALGCSQSAEGQTFTEHIPSRATADGMPGQPVQPSHPRVEQCQGVGAPHSPLRVPLLQRGTPPVLMPEGISWSPLQREPLNKPQSSESLCCQTYCLQHTSNRFPWPRDWVHPMVF